MPKFKNIKQITPPGHYQIDVDWGYLEDWLEDHIKTREGVAGLELNPDFQRGHVWAEEQKIKYVEFKLRGGNGADVIYLNCVGWMGTFEGPFVCVDGLQRITAVTDFLNDKIKVFGYYYSEYEDKIGFCNQASFKININNLKEKDEVLKWYLELNSGGTPHTKEELEKVKKMLEET